MAGISERQQAPEFGGCTQQAPLSAWPNLASLYADWDPGDRRLWNGGHGSMWKTCQCQAKELAPHPIPLRGAVSL